MAGGDVVDQNAHAAEFDVVANAGRGDVEQMFLFDGGFALIRSEDGDQSERAQHADNKPAYFHKLYLVSLVDCY